MPDTEKISKDSESLKRTSSKYIDFEKIKFSLNIAAIFAIIVSVYQFTNFTWKSYHELEKRIHTIEIKYETLLSEYDLLNQKFRNNLENNESTKSKLKEIEDFIEKSRITTTLQENN